MTRFSPMLTVGATVGGAIVACLGGIVLSAGSEALQSISLVGAAVGLVGSLIYQAVTPVK